MVAIFADSNRARMRYIKESDVAWGVTPASGRARELRFTSSSINAQKNTTVSEEIRADRMVSENVEVGANTTGEVGIEFSAGSHDDFMESFMFGAWTRPMTFDSIEGPSLEWGAADTLYVKGKDVTDLFDAGKRIRTHGFGLPANNDYFEIDTITFNAGSNRTEIVVTVASAELERGSSYTALFDANDVIVLKNEDIRAGTAGASTFDSNGTDAFAAAIAAGQLVAGQKVWVEGLGYGVGTVTITTAPPVAGARVTVFDGVKTVIFQWGGSAPQNVTIVPIGANLTASAANLAAAINTKRVRGLLNVSATSAVGAVTLKNLNRIGGSIAETVADANVAVVTFADGDATLGGVYTIESATDDVLTVSPAPATNANAGTLGVTIKGSMLRNPGNPDDIVPQSFTIETAQEDVDQFFIADGLRVGSFAFNVAANSILTGSYSFQGRATTRQGSTKLGDDLAYTTLPTTATPVANATVNVGQIVMNGEELSTALQSITLNGNNNLRDQNAVGYKFPAGIGAGRMEITGSLVAYFANGDLWDKFIEHQTVSVAFRLQDVKGHRYEFTIPAANFGTDTVNPAGGNQDIMENLEFMAKRDPVTECQIQIDRFSCVLPTTA
ncbi:tail tube-like protein [Bajunvirus bajun]|uniref:Tail tube-like protein n=1 Tax=Brevundimonas phage vB_BgoS-Bajun TaxID=2948594 RepID=A0A9E7N6C3_9CAUD|nr:tail tube-like protein [Brevundimonas phage vB_BgoS-Bajun]